MKIMTVIGARPQFIKAATVSRVLRGLDGVKEIIVHTGQHFDTNMSRVFFDALAIPEPRYDLEVAGGGHGQMTGRMLERLEKVVQAVDPDWMLVYGDTNSTLAGALVASKLHVPVAHVEAGLRSFNMRMPEEINRVLTDRVSRLLLCPTERAVRNLMAEGYEALECRVERVGDVMLDAARFYARRALRPAHLPDALEERCFALATVHRAENTDDPVRLRNIFKALNEIHADTPVVIPLHPRTRERLKALGIAVEAHSIEPVGYLEMVWLLSHCSIVLTDSGGLQKEAWFFRRPCVTLRDETEWTELLEVGGMRLAGADARSIIEAARYVLSASPNYDLDLYGQADAAERVVNALFAY